MPLLTLSYLDRRATHQRLPSSTTDDDYGDAADDYADLATDVPIRIEQPEVESRQGVAGDVIRWTGWLLGTAEPPEADDRFDIVNGPLIQVEKVEGLTDLDGNLDHWQLDAFEISRAT